MHEALVQREQRRGTNIFFSGHIDVAYGNLRQRQSIATYGLDGCSALIVSFENPRAVVLGHFQPWRMTQIGDHREPILKMLSSVSRTAKAIGGLLLHQGDADESSVTGYAPWFHNASNNERIADLTNLVKEGVGEDVPVLSAGYFAWGRDVRGDMELGSVIIDLPNDIDKPNTRVGGIAIDLDGALRES
jgi:hypothetical protein